MSSSKNQEEDQEWKVATVSMKRDIHGYLQSKGSSEEDCVIDLLQALYAEGLMDVTKVMVLGVLRELSESLFMDKTSIEQAIGTLIGYYQEVTISKGSIFLKSEILVSMTTILLTGDQLRDQPSLFIEVTNILFDIIAKVNQGPDRVLRETACQCLEEIENIYPCVLMYKLDHFYAMSQLENTHVRQAYVSLFNTVLKNAVQMKSQQSNLKKDVISDMLLTRKEPLKPLNLPDAIPPEMFNLQSYVKNKCILSSDVERSELRGAIMKSMDNLSVMSEPDTVKAVRDVCSICSTCGLPMEIFQEIPKNLTTSLSLPLLHTQLYLMKYYIPESDALHPSSIMRHICHPGISLGHRLLCMQFCMNNSSQFPLDDEDLLLYKPVIFDSLDETLTKLQFIISLAPEGMNLNSFLSYLEPLMTSVRNGAVGKWAVACFRGLFTLYVKDPSEEMDRVVSGFIVEEAVSQHPHFAEHALNFIACIKGVLPDSQFSSHLLQSMTNFITQVSPDKCLENLEHFLRIFNAAAKERSIQLKPVTQYLQDLFNATPVLEDTNWLLGNQMIQICHNLMLHPSLPSLFTSVGEILFALMTFHSDTNIRDVARFYYSMLIYLSEDKIKAILASLEASSNGQNLTNLVTGSSTFPLAAPVVHLQQPMLKLKRLKRSYSYKSLVSVLNNCSFSEYLKTLLSISELPQLLLDFQICSARVADNPELSVSKLYAIVFSVQSPSFYQEIEDFHVPYFSLDCQDSEENEKTVISLTISPKEPNPASLDTRVVFTSTDNQTYTCQLEPLRLDFEDFFLSLPVPSDDRCNLFNQLWTHVDAQCQRDDSLCAQSVMTLPFTSSQLQTAIERKLSDYIITSPCVTDSEWHVGILLPPRWHLLLKMKPTDTTVVTISTDNWKLLPLVSHYLMSFTEAS